MITLERLTREHLDKMRPLQPYQEELEKLLADTRYREALLASEYGYAFVDEEDGSVWCLAGFSKMWEGRYVGWLLLADNPGVARLRSIGETAQIFVSKLNFPRLEATVDVRFTQHIKFLYMLGFRIEGRLKNYVNGYDHYMLARIGK